MILFSYLGANLPKYALLKAKYTQLRFPKIAVGMIVSSTSNANEVENVGINSFVYDTTLNNTLFNDMHAKRQNFRNGFWRYALERLLSLDAYFQDNDEEVIHVESDVVLLNGFEKYESSIIQAADSLDLIAIDHNANFIKAIDI